MKKAAAPIVLKLNFSRLNLTLKGTTMDKHNNPNTMYAVANMTIGPVTEYNIILFRPDYLLADQTPDQANLGRNYALTPKQAMDLAQKLTEAAHALDILKSPNGSGRKH